MEGAGSRHLETLNRLYEEGRLPILICLLGSFRLLREGSPIPRRAAGKTEALLGQLAIRVDRPVTREFILDRLWPNTDTALASHALNSLVHNLHKVLGAAISGAAPVAYSDGCYRINVAAGVGVDIWLFDWLTAAAYRSRRRTDRTMATIYYQRAVQLYHGDLCIATDVQTVVERERLRAQYLSALAELADHAFAEADYANCLHNALRLLGSEPAREDAHRLVMRCYVRRGERAQALRQYQLCVRILEREFDAVPERETNALFDRIRNEPGTV